MRTISLKELRAAKFDLDTEYGNTNDSDVRDNICKAIDILGDLIDTLEEKTTINDLFETEKNKK